MTRSNQSAGAAAVNGDLLEVGEDGEGELGLPGAGAGLVGRMDAVPDADDGFAPLGEEGIDEFAAEPGRTAGRSSVKIDVVIEAIDEVLACYRQAGSIRAAYGNYRERRATIQSLPFLDEKPALKKCVTELLDELEGVEDLAALVVDFEDLQGGSRA